VNKIWSNQTKRVGFQLARGVVGVFSLGIAFLSLPTLAQIVPDSTLGSESSQVTPNVNVGGSLGDRIDGGAVRGSSLFHSFSEFNVNNGQRVYFADPAGIENIFSRVTGSNISNILGTLGVEGAANLFLLNPNGILFGQNARLDIQGSFVASTGDRFIFPDGMEFGASNPQAPPLLTMSVPVGVQYGAQSGTITNAGKLEVGSGQTLALQGSDVTSTGSLSAPGGTVMMLGDRIGLFDNAQINVSSQTGGGTVLIGGGLQGNGAVPNAARTFVDAGVQIEADALVTGDGGSVIIWADEVTGFYGNISARGGIEAGNGGFVEVSGKENLIFRGNVDTSASQGNPGTLLLDPENITIVKGNGVADNSQLDDSQILQGDGGASSFTISQTKLEELSGDTNVILQATNNITINDLDDDQLTFKMGTGKIAFTADSDENGVGSFLMQDVKDTIYTNGRDITISGASLTLGNINTFSISGLENPPTQEVVNVDSGGPIPATGTSGTSTFYFNVPAYLSTSTISDLNVVFSAEHTWVSDLSVSLKSPEGTQLSLFSGVGYSGDNFQDTLLDDEATTSINQGTAPFQGSFRPDGSLAIFDGQKPNGQWTLTVTDNFSGDSGRLFQQGERELVTGTQLIFTLNSNETSIRPGDGKSGSITLNATNGNIKVGNLNTANSTNSTDDNTANDFLRNGGSITLKAQNDIQTGSLDASTYFGNSGDISITSLNGKIITDNYISTATGLPAYNGGDITFEAKGDITINNSTRSDGGDKGVSGEIKITSETGHITVNNTINSLNYGKKGGDINITALAGSIFLTDQAELLSGNTSQATGNGGNIVINTGALSVKNSKINANTEGQGNAGDVIINARDMVYFDGKNSVVDTTTLGSGNGGEIKIETRSFYVANGAQLNASTQDRGQGGNLRIMANSVTLSDDGKLLAETSATGRAGNVSIEATGQVALRGGQISTNIQSGAKVSSGESSNIMINARNLLVTEGGQISALVSQAGSKMDSEAGEGNSGTINITVEENTILSGENSSISNAIEAGAIGQGGSIILNTETLTATGGASIDSSIAGTGNKAGDITLNATGAITFSGTGTEISSEVKQGGNGQGGDIFLSANSLTVDDNAKLLASSSGTGDGGNITVSANTLNLSGKNSGLFAETKGTGTAGNLTLNPYNGNDLQVIFAQEAQISASTSGSGTGGNVTVSAPNSVTLTGDGSDQGGLSASASDQATGDGGSININARRLEMNGAIIRSEAQKSQAGDIILNLDDILLLRHNSLISTTAGTAQAPGNGGNITINAPFVIAVPSENSDIIANAFTGNGGEINITANRVFGLKQQNGQTFDTLRQNRTSDISASSQFGIQGTVTIQSLNVDPSQGLGELPIEVVDPSNQIATGCGATGGTTANRQSEFVVTGRGGLPAQPDDLQTPGSLSPEWVTRDLGNVNRADIPDELLATDSTDTLVEAQGMFINAKGELILTTQASQTHPSQSGLSTKFCSPVGDRH